jgi:hypothetical protein
MLLDKTAKAKPKEHIAIYHLDTVFARHPAN